MFDKLEYYWDEYKNYIIISFLGLIFLGFVIYYFVINKTIEVDKLGDNNVELNFNKAKKEIKLTNDIGDKNTTNYNYRVKVLVSKYDLVCNGEKNICDKINRNKDKLKGFILGSYSGNLKNLDEFKLNLDDFFNKKFDETNFKTSSLDLVYTFQNNFVKQNNIKKSGFEKYFKFKLKPGEKEVSLNNLEIQCASQIRMSIIPGTFEEDKIIEEQVKEKCINLGGNSLKTLNDKNIKKDDYSLILEIKELNVKYDFLKKQQKDFEVVDSKKIIVPYNKKIIIKTKQNKKD